MNIINHDDLHYYIFLLTVTFILIPTIIFMYKTSYSEYSSEKLITMSYFTPISNDNTYYVPDIGFSIVLPENWNKIDNQNILMISPNKINENTGSIKYGKDKIIMIIQIVDVPDFDISMKKYNEGFHPKGCTTLSDNFVEINNINSRKTFKQCEFNENEKILNYIFATEKSIIFVGLKGTDLAFDNNIDKFVDSIKTIKIKNAIDIRQFATSNFIP